MTDNTSIYVGYLDDTVDMCKDIYAGRPAGQPHLSCRSHSLLLSTVFLCRKKGARPMSPGVPSYNETSKHRQTTKVSCTSRRQRSPELLGRWIWVASKFVNPVIQRESKVGFGFVLQKSLMLYIDVNSRCKIG